VSFLAPWLLGIAAAATVPLLIHLLRRRIDVTVDFPAARYLARAEREHSRSLRMRNLLLMLLRIAAVVLLALAAARPTTWLAGAGHAPTALAIVLDNSLSTSVIEDGAPLLDTFKRMALEVVGQASPDDRIYLVTVDGAVRGGAPAAIADEIDRVRAHAGAGRPDEAVARAIAAVRASGLAARQVAVVTDGQRSAWRNPASPSSDVPVLVYAPAGDPPANRALTSADARPSRWTPRGALSVRVVAPDSTTYRMELAGRTLARGTVAPGEESTLRANPPERGWTAGVVEIQPDELVADNRRHFAVWIGAPPAVRVVPGAGEFLRDAVDVLRASERVVAGNGIIVASADEATTLPALLVPPADPVRIGAANRGLERLGVPWRFGQVRRDASIARGEHLQQVNVSLRYDLVPRGMPDAESLAVVGERPWIVAGPGYVLAGSPIHPDATTLPVSAGFLPWLTDVLSSRLHAEPGVVRYATPGATLSRPADVDAIESAAGGRTMLAQGTRFDAPAAAGTWFFVRGTRRVGALVVNPEAEESMLERWPRDRLDAQVASRARVARDPAEWVRRAFSGASQRSLVVPLLVAVLLVLGAELIVAAADARRARA